MFVNWIKTDRERDRGKSLRLTVNWVIYKSPLFHQVIIESELVLCDLVKLLYKIWILR